MSSPAKKMDVHFSSKSDDWATPQDFFDKMSERYTLVLDVCASKTNYKCRTFFTSEGLFQVEDGAFLKLSDQNGLNSIWRHPDFPEDVLPNCWMNPPYGRGIGAWVKKAYEESQKGCLVVCLLPARTDTKWFHDYCVKGEIEFIKGRLKFGGAKNAAPFPSMVVVFRGKDAK